MKKLYIIALALLAFSCSDDGGEANDFQLSYDAANDNAPVLLAGVHTAAARFTPAQTNSLDGQFLERIDFYLQEYPDQCTVLVFDEGTNNSPGALLYSADVTFVTENFDWNTHILTTPIQITGDDIWLAIEVEHVDDYPSIGCDPGPANSNGDWMYSSSDSQWRTFRDRTGNAASINWNIRGYVN